MPAENSRPSDSVDHGERKNASAYEKMFHPGRMAIFGVSLEGGSVGLGNGFLLALQAMGYKGEIFPVNPKGGSFSGLNILKSIEDIQGDIDFAIIALAARMVPDALEACRKKGAAGEEILSSGFSELGTPEGISLEREISRIAARGIRVIGPNCFGIYCPKSGLTFMPSPDLSRESGPVAFLSQSGGMASDFANTGKWMGIRFSKVVSFGNGADLREIELLRYLGEDPETRVISMYVEGIKDGDLFFRTMKSVAGKNPVIVYKERIETYLPKPGCSGANPVDIANPYVPPQQLKEVLRHAATDERIDLQVMISLLYCITSRPSHAPENGLLRR